MLDRAHTLFGMTDRLIRELERRMARLNLDPTTTAKRAGLGESFVRDIIRGRSTEPKRSGLEKVAKVLGCTVADLLGERVPPPLPRALTDNVTVNELDVHTRAGLGADGDTVVMASQEAAAIIGVHSFPTASFREAYGVEPGRIKIIAVRGDSMEPKLWAGQRVMVDIHDTTPSPPGIFVVWDGLGLAIKRVEVIPGTDPLRVRISSANPEYLAYERLFSEAAINGRVIGVWART